MGQHLVRRVTACGRVRRGMCSSLRPNAAVPCPENPSLSSSRVRHAHLDAPLAVIPRGDVVQRLLRAKKAGFEGVVTGRPGYRLPGVSLLRRWPSCFVRVLLVPWT